MNSKEKNKKEKNFDLSMRKDKRSELRTLRELKKEQEALAEELAGQTSNIPPFRRGS